MRAVVAVLLFVIAAHATLWGVLQQKQQAPDFKGILLTLTSTISPTPRKSAPT
jgi:hypothetical protein